MREIQSWIIPPFNGILLKPFTDAQVKDGKIVRI